MGLAVTLFLAFIAFEAAGYWLHRLLHSPTMGRLHVAHMHHHDLYPVHDFTSQVYRAAGASSTVWPILVVCLVVGALLLWLAPWRYALPLMGELALVGYLNDRIHGWFHITGSGGRLQDLHVQHHRDPRTNYGILTFLSDRLWGTYRG